MYWRNLSVAVISFVVVVLRYTPIVYVKDVCNCTSTSQQYGDVYLLPERLWSQRYLPSSIYNMLP